MFDSGIDGSACTVVIVTIFARLGCGLQNTVPNVSLLGNEHIPWAVVGGEGRGLALCADFCWYVVALLVLFLLQNFMDLTSTTDGDTGGYKQDLVKAAAKPRDTARLRYISCNTFATFVLVVCARFDAVFSIAVSISLSLCRR